MAQGTYRDLVRFADGCEEAFDAFLDAAGCLVFEVGARLTIILVPTGDFRLDFLTTEPVFFFAANLLDAVDLARRFFDIDFEAMLRSPFS